MAKVVGVRFQSGGRIYYFDPVEWELHLGDGVIVETARGQEYGTVAQDVMDVEESSLVSPLKPVIRVATPQDETMRAQNTGKEDEAFAICQRKIAQHGLDMKLVNVEYAFNGSKVVFYFTADERVDFRELVKDLASQFRTRIELRQIGVRDEAKMLGGLGSCGRPVCCKTFLDEFRPVSIKMAKEQNLSLSPTKISGLCGRLMCCLQYEQAAYEEIKKRMPRTGREVVTPDGVGIAVENNAITEKTRVRLTLPDGSIDMREYHFSRLCKPGETLPEQPAPEKTEAEGETIQPAARPVQPAQPGGTQEEPEKGEQPGGQQRRRRRGGHGRGKGPAAEGAKPEGGENRPKQNQEQNRPRQGGGRPQGDNRRPQGNRPPKQGGESGAQPRPEARQGEGTPNPNRRRRRRSGSGNRQGNQGGAPTGGPTPEA